MRYPPEETAEKHARILEQASILFREHGFSGVSLSEIMKATGLTHGAFYNHFESKEDLIAKSIEDTSAKALASMRERGARGEQRAQYVDGYLTEQHRDDRGNGCMMAGLAGEIAREPAAQPAFTQHVEGMLKGFTEPGAKTKKKNARRDAIHTLSSIVGALILARAVDDPELSEEILRETRAALD
ncbi:TetR/AcrR family transcriptional regulator [Cupriavidus sp. IK-TO18]|uniref:TetR/AcrR family transcriptional regulator n=2 Tax=Burkholderiaceae TaxID=119060 RepID=A0A4P7LC27_9BURK|nr:TetR/AcrR family transcriptional regulator [Cupriavidus sp. IK-TO18]QBY51619.1 TetR/AcrR family transcriptional regulator [Cupriavidus oxalaticus]